MNYYIVDDITDSSCKVEAIYYSEEEASQDQLDHVNNKTFLFDFEVEYTTVPEADSDGEEPDYMGPGVETRFTTQQLEYDRDWFINGEDDVQITSTVYTILYELGVPPYRDIMTTFIEDMQSIMNQPMEKLKKIKVTIDVMAEVARVGVGVGVEAQDVRYLVGGASVEAMEQHLEILTENVESVEDCVICMETIQVGSDVVARMPSCKHVFHRPCIEKWLENTAVCPLCRAVFPV